ncbi:MAG: beta-lactamase family protein [Archangium sp.]|nr:beta-lactamase family protein [Archangium sp.]
MRWTGLIAMLVFGCAPLRVVTPSSGTDVPRTTASGHTYLAPATWTVVDQPDKRITILRPPGGGENRLAIIELASAESPEAAARAAGLLVGIERPFDGPARRSADRNGFTQLVDFSFLSAASEHRALTATTRAVGTAWVVVIVDLDESSYTRLGPERGKVVGTLAAKGYVRPTLVGKQPHRFDARRRAALDAFVESARETLGVPGVAIGLIQDGEVVMRAGYGVRALGQSEPVTPSTRFMLWSATKPLTTLMLASLVHEQKVSWNTPVSKLLPQLAFGDARATKLELRHLVSASSGAARQDLEWTYRGQSLTANDVVELVRQSKPANEIGARFEYANLPVAVAGFAAGHVAYPELELGAAYDRVMQTRVFIPLGMRDTTLDHVLARTGNFAVGHEHDPDGVLRTVDARVNATVCAVRPTGGAWSTVDDLLRYVTLELGEGTLDGAQVMPRTALLARREEQVQLTQGGYGLGLFIERGLGPSIYSHSGDGHGFNANVLWIPEARIGAVILTNSTAGATLRNLFRRKLLELFFDLEPGAEQSITLAVQTRDQLRSFYRPLLERPPSAEMRARLASRYRHPALGDFVIVERDGRVWLQTEAWESEAVIYRDKDFLALATWDVASADLEIIDGPPRALVVSDGTHRYVLEEVTK